MLLVVDIGNTNVVMALHDGSSWVADWRIYSDQKKTSDEYFVIVERMLSHGGFSPGSIDRSIISSVVPNLTRSFQKVIRTLGTSDPIMVSHESASTLKRESIPAELGFDLLANAVAAHAKFPDDLCMILDFGTALTLTTVTAEGEVVGAAIAPGLVTAVNSLFYNTAQIPQVQLKIPERAIGRDSDEAIRSGIMYGYAGLVKELVKRSEEELGVAAKVLATGGLSRTIAPLIGRIDYLEPLLTLEGLRIMADAHR
jgi:type III pantothenate kinase